MDTITLSEGGRPQSVRVHPLVLFSILDHYTRRPEQQEDGRVIGTLLGWVSDNHVEIVNSFAVPHSEKADEVAVGQNYNKTMYSLHQRVNKREQVVGWCAATPPLRPRGPVLAAADAREGGEREEAGWGRGGGHGPYRHTPLLNRYATSISGVSIVDSSSLIHGFYSQECENPVHLTVDTSLAGDTISVRAFVSSPLQISGTDVANIFQQLKVQMESNEAERICIDRMLKGPQVAAEPPTTEDDELALVSSDAFALERSMERLLAMLETSSEFVDRVVAGDTPADEKLGRYIADALAVVPRIRPEVFDKIFNGQLQDLLMVSYLSNLTKTQLDIATKLHSALK